MKSSLKKTVSVIVLLSAEFILFAHGGVMTGMHDLKIIGTTYFDILYPPESQKTAALVAEHIDAMYEGICVDLNEEPWLHMPVTITPIRDEMNAYFTPAYYNMIVLYDTVPTEQLAVNTQNLLQVLYHELVHAVTMNMKSDSLKKNSKLFGDFWAYHYLTAPCSVLEGTAVAFESKTGEGRLNDPFSTQIVKQAKIEGQFPSYKGTYMARDIYPVGSVPYVIGGSFISWLYQTYGAVRFTSFWRSLVSLTDDYQMTDKQLKKESLDRPFYEIIFKRVYGIAVGDAWHRFYESIAVPDVAADPVDAGEAKDFFIEEKTATAKRRASLAEQEAWNNKGSRYVSVTSCNKGVAWIDASCGAVWYASLSADRWQKPRKLFTLTDVSRISFSSDGLYLAVSCAKTVATTKFRVGVYSMKSKSLVFAPQTGNRDAAIITNADGSHVLAAVHTQSQFSQLVFLTLNEKNGKCRGFIQPYDSTTALTWNRVPFSVCDAGAGVAAYIAKDGMRWSVQLYDPATQKTECFFPKNEQYILENLAPGAEKNTFLFVWGERGSDVVMLPRFGMLDLRGSEPVWTFQNRDISGGVHFPAVLPGSEHMIVYSSQCYTNTKLLILSMQNNTTVLASAGESVTLKETDVESELTPDTSIAQNARTYHDYLYWNKGSFIPFSIVPVSDTDFNASYFSLIGATWFTSNPWMDKVLSASVAFDPFTLTGGMFASFTGGTDGGLFAYTLSGTSLFDSYGFCQTYDTVALTSSLPVGNVSKIVFSAESLFFNGKDRTCNDVFALKDCFTSPEHMTLSLHSRSTGAMLLTTVHRTGPGKYEKGGVFASVDYLLEYKKTNTAGDESSDLFNTIGAAFGFQVPCLIPKSNPYGVTLNLPLTAQIHLFDDVGSFETHSASLILFSAEIQQPIDSMHLYCNRLTVEGIYKGTFKYQNPQSWDLLRTADLIAQHESFSYYDTASLTIHTYLSVNEGEIARYPFDLSSTVYYRIRPQFDEQKWGFGMFGKVLF